jgi:hypothetical protein
VRPASQIDLNREFKSPRHIEWQWFLVPLLAFTIIVFSIFGVGAEGEGENSR